MKTGRYIKGLIDLMFPACCPVCGRHLAEGERFVCISCLYDLPRLEFDGRGQGEVWELFAGSRIVERAVSMFRYGRTSPYSEILKDVKYRNRPELAEALARQFAVELADAGYFDGMDAVVPVPLHRKKLEKRGYNQSRFVAEGLAGVAGLPVEDGLRAVRPHATQTFRTAEERRRNVDGVFRAESSLEGKSVVLVDDVITTGATLSACCDALRDAGVRSVRIVSLAFANTING